LANSVCHDNRQIVKQPLPVYRRRLLDHVQPKRMLLDRLNAVLRRGSYRDLNLLSGKTPIDQYNVLQEAAHAFGLF
jgi:hypothetical protein